MCLPTRSCLLAVIDALQFGQESFVPCDMIGFLQKKGMVECRIHGGFPRGPQSPSFRLYQLHGGFASMELAELQKMIARLFQAQSPNRGCTAGLLRDGGVIENGQPFQDAVNQLFGVSNRQTVFRRDGGA